MLCICYTHAGSKGVLAVTAPSTNAGDHVREHTGLVRLEIGRIFGSLLQSMMIPAAASRLGPFSRSGGSSDPGWLVPAPDFEMNLAPYF